MRTRTGKVDFAPISYPESSGSLASAWSPGDQPLTKEPEDSGYEIDFVPILFPEAACLLVGTKEVWPPLAWVRTLGTRMALFILSQIKEKENM